MSLRSWLDALWGRLRRRDDPALPTEPSTLSETAVTPAESRWLGGYSLRLLNPGPRREDVTHQLHEFTGLSLIEVRALVEAAPSQVVKQVDPYTGRALLKRLETLGATCELVSGMATTTDLAVPLPGPVDVVLFAPGAQPTRVMQVLRDLLDTSSFQDAERLLRVTPKLIARQVAQETAVTLQRHLEAAGATVRLVHHEAESLPETSHPDNSAFLFGDYDVQLQSTGPDPKQVITVLRDLLNYRNLSEIELLIATPPQRLIQSVPLATAETIQRRLQSAGAGAIIIPATS